MAEEKKSQGKLLALHTIRYGDGGEVKTFEPGEAVDLPKEVLEDLKASGSVTTEKKFARLRPELLDDEEEEEEPVRFTEEAEVRLQVQEEQAEEYDQQGADRLKDLRKMAKDK